jgi:hypothetical protein
MRSSVEWNDTTARPAAGGKHLLGRDQPIAQLVQLAVQVDANRLKGAGRRVLLLVRPMPQRAAHDLRQLGRRGERPRRHDRARHPAGARLVTIFEQDVRYLGLVGAVQPFRGGLAGLAHPHVEGPSAWNEKPRSAWSSCIDDTPMSSVTPSTASTSRRPAPSPSR